MPLLFVIQQMLLICTACPPHGPSSATLALGSGFVQQETFVPPVNHSIAGLLHNHRAATMEQCRSSTRADPAAAIVTGHGNFGTDKSSNMPLLFVIQQVSDGNCVNFRSDNRFIIVLPCPQVFFDCAMNCRDNLLLLLSGDVERNPGPETRLETMISQVLENQKQLKSELKEVKENQIASQQRQNAMADKITHLETALDVLQKSNQQILQLQGTLQSLEELVYLQREKIADLEDRGRRNNLIVFGIPETPNETVENLKQSVINTVFQQQLGVTVKTVERIHRLGKRTDGKIRPVILKLWFKSLLELLILPVLY
ncbi:uncharacterized protein ISCGN_008007 [Ixodes scapularis]